MKKILLLEDEKMIRDIYVTKLKQAGDFKIFQAVTSDQAEEVLEKEKIDLIILDIILPKEDGLSYLGRLREKNIKIPVIVLSNLEGEDYRKKAKELKATKYILKTSYTPSEIIEAIKKYL